MQTLTKGQAKVGAVYASSGTFTGDLTVSGTLTNSAYAQTATNIDAGASGTAGSVDIFPATASKGKVAITKTNNTNNDTTSFVFGAHGQATTITVPDPGAAAATVVLSTAALTLAEADFLDGATAGTQVASKAVIADANVNIGVVKATALHIGVSGSETQVTATAAEINAFCDQSAGVQAITSAGAVAADGTINRATLSGGAYAITLAVPGAAAIGKFLCIEYVGGDTDAVTLANTNLISGSAGTTYTFNADGEGLLLFGAATKWVVVKEFGGITIA